MLKHGDNTNKNNDNLLKGLYKNGITHNIALLCQSIFEKAAVQPEALNKTFASQQQIKTFSEVLSLWISTNRIRLKGSTINKYQNLIDTHINPELGAMQITEIDTIKINSFINAKLSNGKLNGTGGLSPSYVRSIMFIINSAIKLATDEQLCAPLKNTVCKPSIQKTELTILSHEEQQKMESYLLNDFTPSAAGVLIALYTGMRLGEICALSWDDVDLTNKVIKIRHTVARVKNETNADSKTRLILDTPKTKSSLREIPILNVLASILTRLRDISQNKYVISGTNNFMNPRTFEYHFHIILNKCGINCVNFHTLRHTFATRCVEAGVDIKSLSEILGHSNVGITLNTYVHSSLEMKRIQLEKLTVFST